MLTFAIPFGNERKVLEKDDACFRNGAFVSQIVKKRTGA